MAEKKYSNVPLDEETYQMVKTLAQAKGFGERGQGAVVRALVKAEYEKLTSAKLTQVPASGNQVIPVQSHAPEVAVAGVGDCLRAPAA